MEGKKELLGMWVSQNEEAKFWLNVITELKNRGAFPNDEAALKLLYLATRNAAKKWSLPIHHWKQALNQFAIIFEERFPETLE